MRKVGAAGTRATSWGARSPPSGVTLSGVEGSKDKWQGSQGRQDRQDCEKRCVWVSLLAPSSRARRSRRPPWADCPRCGRCCSWATCSRPWATTTGSGLATRRATERVAPRNDEQGYTPVPRDHYYRPSSVLQSYTINRLSSTIYHLSPIINHLSPIINHQSSIISHRSSVIIN